MPVEVICWAEIWKLPLVEPSLGGNELKYVSGALKQLISSQNAFVSKFEGDFAFSFMVLSIAVSSGTTATSCVSINGYRKR